MMEIGGYFELEHFNNHPYYPDLYELNLGRTALVCLLETLSCKALHVPYFICDSVTKACEKAGFPLRYYHLDENLAPILEQEPAGDEYLYLINYYGQLSDEQILAFSQRFSRIIVDNTHSFFQRPLKNIPTLYSCRKFFGVSDGAYLSCSQSLPPISVTDRSGNRMSHLLGRFEGSASEYYTSMLAAADSFHGEPVKNMSPITRNILGGIDYDGVRRTRNRNYQYLSERLEQDNVMSRIVPNGPFAYPFYTKHGPAVRRELTALRIYIPTYWHNVIVSMPEDSVEYDLAANILPLPCDQRYGTWEMEHLADAILTVLQQLGE